MNFEGLARERARFVGRKEWGCLKVSREARVGRETTSSLQGEIAERGLLMEISFVARSNAVIR